MRCAKRAPANRLLAGLPAIERRRLLAQAEEVDLAAGTVLGSAGSRIDHVYFPIDAYVALVADAGGARLEVGLVGHEGMLGITLMLGVAASPLQWRVQGAGRAWRIDAALFVRQLAGSPGLRRKLNRYLYVALAQLAQTAACRRFHMVEGRLASRLLMARDRVRGNSLHATHETLAGLMGVRRAGISRAAHTLQKRRLIRYARGNVQILDGQGLQAASCGCYAADHDIYARVMEAPGR